MPYIGRAPTSTATKLEDADQDTKIQVEESSDEDIIRFDIAGAEVVTLTNSNLVLKGTTPTLTIGDAGAEDTKIVFDGNAQDYYIGLDDTDDDLKIGLGSAVGTTAHMVFNETGAVTLPLQPGFFVKQAAQGVDVTGDGTIYTPTWGTEMYDRNNDVSGATFTAPVAGFYAFTYQWGVKGLASNHTSGNLTLVTSNDYHYLWSGDFGAVASSDGYIYNVNTQITYMDAADTATMTVRVNGGSKTVDFLGGNSQSNWSGVLLS